MKTLLTSLALGLLALASQTASATILRVNNTGISGTNIYADLDVAYTAAVAGDIIQVEPSGTAYTGITVAKNVTIVGPGYFLAATENPGLQANPLTATVGNINIAAGGEGAYIAGLTVSSFQNRASNVTIQRCRVTSVIYPNATSPAVPLTNVTIQQCYLESSGLAVYASGALDNMLITNNIFEGSASFPTNWNGGFFQNVVVGYVTMSNFFITNNYFGYTSAYAQLNGRGNTITYNLSADTTFPTTNGNQAGIVQSAVFVLAPGATQFDAWYVLKTGTNPARATGSGGVDIGAFGGSAPYKLGGLPNIPAIYQQTQTISGNSLNVNLSTRANN